jgi:flagellar protein FlaJ
MSWGVSLADALTKFADRVETRLARRTSFILAEIHRGGGDIREILETVSHHIGELQTIDRERQTQIKPYIAIVYVAFLIFLVIDILLIKTFFSEMESMKTLMMESGGSLLSAGIEVSKITQIMFHITMFEGFFGGLVAGKMGENYINAGLKHSLILMIIGFLTFYLIVWTSIIPI